VLGEGAATVECRTVNDLAPVACSTPRPMPASSSSARAGSDRSADSCSDRSASSACTTRSSPWRSCGWMPPAPASDRSGSWSASTARRRRSARWTGPSRRAGCARPASRSSTPGRSPPLAVPLINDFAPFDEAARDLVAYADEQVTTGAEAEAYASYIDGHLAKIADGATYADMGPTVRAAQDAVTAAQDAGKDATTVAGLQATADQLSGQRDSLFKGETLRGLLLSTFAWSTLGRIAGIAAIVAFIAAGVMIVLVVAGMIHRSRTTAA
jgi:hypothetical protein